MSLTTCRIAALSAIGDLRARPTATIIPSLAGRAHFGCIELKGCLDGNNTNIFDRPRMPRSSSFGAYAATLVPILSITPGLAFTRGLAPRLLKARSLLMV